MTTANLKHSIAGYLFIVCDMMADVYQKFINIQGYEKTIHWMIIFKHLQTPGPRHTAKPGTPNIVNIRISLKFYSE